MSAEQAVSLFSQTWSALFEGQQLRPMKKGIREDIFADIAARPCPEKRYGVAG
ncbi:Uncharacterised protein [Cedecea neteri]|uniref:Uncharacterized protein n=1 Tax=Cedecea neteri TaxID=158822 RepID=A0A2X3J7S9_9ENTR|nr:hypothetical protein [Cedecea neteri]SQC92073.1 Uncharacterised protein [Cedecea neteri]